MCEELGIGSGSAWPLGGGCAGSSGDGGDGGVEGDGDGDGGVDVDGVGVGDGADGGDGVDGGDGGVDDGDEGGGEFFSMSGMELEALCLLGKCPTTNHTL